MIILSIHPVIQCAAILLAFYVLFLGIQRFRSFHMQQKTHFRWKRHVFLGTTALIVLFGGFFGGMMIVYIYWHGFFITKIHSKVALVIIQLLLIGLFTGLYLNRRKKKEKVIPAIHGINNFLLLLLSITQIITGLKIYINFVLGR